MWICFFSHALWSWTTANTNNQRNWLQSNKMNEILPHPHRETFEQSNFSVKCSECWYLLLWHLFWTNKFEVSALATQIYSEFNIFPRGKCIYMIQIYIGFNTIPGKDSFKWFRSTVNSTHFPGKIYSCYFGQTQTKNFFFNLTKFKLSSAWKLRHGDMVTCIIINVILPSRK